jgi:hypothetical protein
MNYILTEKLRWGAFGCKMNDGLHFGAWFKINTRPFELGVEIMFWKWAVTLGRTYFYEKLEMKEDDEGFEDDAG